MTRWEEGEGDKGGEVEIKQGEKGGI